METYDATPRLVGSKSAADVLGIEKSTLSRLVKAGSVPIVTRLDGPNGAIVFDLEEIQRLAKRRARSKEIAK